MLRKVLIFVFLLPIFIYGCGPTVKNLGSRGTDIICFGNSLTYGPGIEGDGDYPSYLEKLLGREVINAGRSGDTTRDALKRLEKDVLARDPCLVIVEFGTNDYFRSFPKEETMANLKKIILKIQEKGAIVALCDVSGGKSLFGGYNIYHRELKQLARETGSIFIPRLMKDIIQDPSLKTDRVHPNSEGYKIFAERVYKAIKPYL